MTPMMNMVTSQGLEPENTRQYGADEATQLTSLLHRAQRACTTSRHFSLCLRMAMQTHSERGPPG